MTFHTLLVGNAINRAWFALILLGAWVNGQSQIAWEFDEPVDVADASFGNRCPKLALDPSGNAVVMWGKSGDGLYVSKQANGVFSSPMLIPTESNVFLSDAEGPDLATWGNTLGVAYQLSGQWDSGARFIRSDDMGETWSSPAAIAPDATIDHFMPIPAFDDDGNPFVALKLGSGNSAQEAVLLSMDGGATWGEASVASGAAGNGIACECCPSRTIFGNGRYHTIYRRNNSNVRDMWLVSSADGWTWDQQLDLDPTDWVIPACPEDGTSSSWLPDGQLCSVFRSGADGSSKVYLNMSDPASNDAGSTIALTAMQFSNPLQAQPDVATGPDHTVVAWEQNLSGYEIQLSVAPNQELPDALVDVAVPLSEALAGSNRHPDVAVHGHTVHVIWQNSADGTVKYLRGALTPTTQINPLQNATTSSNPRLERLGPGLVELRGATPHSAYRIYNQSGSLLHEGVCRGDGSSRLPSRVTQLATQAILQVQAQTNRGPVLLRLGIMD